MAKELVKFFSPDAYGGGGSFFTDGPYRIDEARFVNYDFNGSVPGRDGKGICSLCLKLQPLGKDGDDAGEVVVQYWSVGDDALVEEKGHSVSLTGDRGTVWALSDFGIFIDHLGKAGFDRDAMEEENDIAVLDSTVMEFGKIPSPRTGGKEKLGKDGKPMLKQIIVVTGVPEVKAAKGKPNGKPAAAAKKGKGSDEAEEMLSAYLVKNVLIGKNEAKGVDKLQARMGIGRYVQANGGDADMAKAVTVLFNKSDVLDPLLESAGWKLDGSTISKAD